MSDENEAVAVRLPRAWFSPQVIIMLTVFVVSSFISWKMGDYRLGKVEDSVAALAQELKQRAAVAESEGREWARTSARIEARLEQLAQQQRELREDLQLANARIMVLERKVQ